jgi:energy-coupling factor transporter transmembrane protein EcfT
MVAVESIRRAVLWALIASSAFVAIEPSPYEFLFALVAIVFAAGGFRFDRAFVPMILTMALFSAGGFLALAPYVDVRKSVTFTFITFYITLTMIAFAALVAQKPEGRLATIRSGYVFSASIAAWLGIIGYFNIAGLGPLFTLYDNSRAAGPFKDPNVFGPFLVAPIVWLAQDVLIGREGLVKTSLKIAPLMVAAVLSFSRGAWIDVLSALAMLFALTFLGSGRSAGRRRVVLIGFWTVGLLAALIAVALAIPQVREMLIARASFVQDYDSGVEGRFGNQARAIPLLLGRPLGFGPLRFSDVFPQDPHEAFLSAFASFGWAGGLGFAAFTAATIYVGWKLALTRSPLQYHAIAIWSACFPQILQGVQIDTGHWRHLYLLCGCVYGLAAAERLRSAAQASTKLKVAPMAEASNPSAVSS